MPDNSTGGAAMVAMSDAISVLFPNSIPGIDWVVADDGTGPRIARWTLSNLQPTSEQIAAVTQEQVDRLRNPALTISRKQGRLMLLQMGLLTQVEALVQSAGTTAVISYDADTWHRNDPVLIQLAAALEIDETQLAELFYQASKI